MSFRNIYMIFGTLLVILLWLVTDPNSYIVTKLPFGASTIAMLTLALQTVIYVAILHVSRKALMDYLDLEKVFNKAMQTAEGAGYVFVGVGLVMVAISVLILAAVD